MKPASKGADVQTHTVQRPSVPRPASYFSLAKQHRSGRHKSSSRSTTSSGEKSKEEHTTDAHVLGAGNIHSPKDKCQEEESGGFSVASSDGSFDPIALANQRTDYYSQQHQTAQQPGAFHQGLPSETASSGTKKSSDRNPTAMHMVSPSSTKSRPSSYKSPGVSPSSRGTSGASYEHAVIAHEVVPVDVDAVNVKEDVTRMAEENRAFRAQLQAQNEAERLRMMEENERIQREMREKFQRQKEIQEAEEVAKRLKQRRCMKIVLLVVVVAGIGFGAYFGTKTSSPTPTDEQNPAPSPATSSPSAIVSKETSEDTSSPYEPPSVQECENMEKGLPRGNDYEGILNRQFDVIFYAQVSSDVSSSSTVSVTLLSVLEQQIERLLRPEMVGCSAIGRRRRNLLLAEQHNRRQLDDFDYLIYDFEVSLAQDTESTCTVNGQNTEPCHVLVASMDVWLQGDEPSLLVRGHIFELLSNLDLAATLELESQFDIIVVEDVRDTLNIALTGAPTESPVSNPTTSAGEGPSNAAPPTGSPSKAPTMAPTPEPTAKSSPLPTSPPTTAPVTRPTSPPTVRPNPEPTPQPTPPPTTPPTQPPANTPSTTGSCDLSQYFKDGFYYEFDGGLDQSYVVSCSSVSTGTRGIALAVDESTCNFTCVGRKKPGSFCNGQPPPSTIQLTVIGDNTGSKIYLGTDALGKGQQFLDCDPIMNASS